MKEDRPRCGHGFKEKIAQCIGYMTILEWIQDFAMGDLKRVRLFIKD